VQPLRIAGRAHWVSLRIDYGRFYVNLRLFCAITDTNWSARLFYDLYPRRFRCAGLDKNSPEYICPSHSENVDGGGGRERSKTRTYISSSSSSSSEEGDEAASEMSNISDFISVKSASSEAGLSSETQTTFERNHKHYTQLFKLRNG
jgi:hypothetical protein